MESAASFPIATPKTHIKWCLGSSQEKKNNSTLQFPPTSKAIAYVLDTGYH